MDRPTTPRRTPLRPISYNERSIEPASSSPQKHYPSHGSLRKSASGGTPLFKTPKGVKKPHLVTSTSTSYSHRSRPSLEISREGRASINGLKREREKQLQEKRESMSGIIEARAPLQAGRPRAATAAGRISEKRTFLERARRASVAGEQENARAQYDHTAGLTRSFPKLEMQEDENGVESMLKKYTRAADEEEDEDSSDSKTPTSPQSAMCIPAAAQPALWQRCPPEQSPFKNTFDPSHPHVTSIDNFAFPPPRPPSFACAPPTLCYQDPPLPSSMSSSPNSWRAPDYSMPVAIEPNVDRLLKIVQDLQLFLPNGPTVPSHKIDALQAAVDDVLGRPSSFPQNPYQPVQPYSVLQPYPLQHRSNNISMPSDFAIYNPAFATKPENNSASPARPHQRPRAATIGNRIRKNSLLMSRSEGTLFNAKRT